MPAADGCLALLTRECQILAHPTQQYSVIGIELPAAIVAAINRKDRPLRNAAVPRGFERFKQRPGGYGVRVSP